MRATYEDLMAHPEKVEAALKIGEERARAISHPFVQRLREAVGLRSLSTRSDKKADAKEAKAALPSFKQYRESDGKFYFKLVAADGKLLLQSTGFTAPKEAGQAIGRLQKEAGALQSLASQLATVEGVSEADVLAALKALADAA